MSSTPSNVHDVAKAGFGAGNDLYDRARPSYPTAAISTLHDSLSVQKDINVLELGSGTGIFTRALLAHPSFATSVKQLRAVEPSEGMRSTFSKSLDDSRVSTYEGTFQKTGVEDGWADLVVVAQAWHWCPDYNNAMVEISRSLKPNGVAAFIWNLEDRDSTRWVAQLRDAYEIYEQGTPQFRHGFWRQTFDTEAYKQLFKPQEEFNYRRVLPTTEQGVYDRAFSKSYVAVLDDEEKELVKDKIQDILDQGDDKVWIDESLGIFEYPYTTLLVVMHKA